MKHNTKLVLFTVTLIILLTGLTALSAADTNDTQTVPTTNHVQTTTQDTIEHTASQVQTTDNKAAVKEDKKVRSNTKNLKKTKDITVNNSNYNTYFKNSGLSNVDDGDTIYVSGTIQANQPVVIDKAVTITSASGSTGKIYLNTTSGSYFGNETGNSFTITNTGSHTNISNINFYNTQIFVKNATKVTFDNVNVTVENQRIGSGVGVVSIRDNSSFVTVKNSNITVNNNSGSSCIVLAWANNCTLQNNVITGKNTVGNLIYLTTYNVAGQDYTNVTLNRGNRIVNNTVNGPSTKSAICYGITLSGGDNFVENNIINYAGQGITTQWMSTSSINWSIGDNYQRYVGNTYKNNILNNGSSFTASLNSTITNNTCSGTVNSGENSTLENNTFSGTVKLQSGSNATKDNVSIIYLYGKNVVDNVYVSDTMNIAGSNCVLKNNYISYLYVKPGVTNITSTNNTINEKNNKTISSNVNNLRKVKFSSLKSTPIDFNESEYQNVYVINDDNYNTYIRSTGTIRTPKVRGNTLFIVESLPDSIPGIQCGTAASDFANYKMTFVGKDNLVLKNKFLSAIAICNVTFINFTIDITDTSIYDYYPYALYSDADDSKTNLFHNITIHQVYDSENLMDELNCVSLEKNTIIEDCTFNATLPSNYINWDTTNHPMSIAVKINGNNNILRNNNIFVNGTDTLNASYNTIYSCLVTGSNNTIINNNISGIAENYLYHINVRSSNNTICNNNITAVSDDYCSGIMMEGIGFQNNTISNNYINLTCGMDSSNPITNAEDVIYGITITDFLYSGGAYTPGKGNITNNTISNNTIIATGYNTYAIEQFGGDNTTISNNTINISGYTPMAVGVIGAYCNITNNNISVAGEYPGVIGTADYLKGRTVGIYNYFGTNNTITNNNIKTITGPGIILEGQANTTVTNNTVKTTNNTRSITTISGSNGNDIEYNLLKADGTGGDASVNATSEDTVKNNGVLKTNTTITTTPVNGKVGDTVTITATTANITDGSTVTFTVDGTVIGNATVANNTASIDYALNNTGAQLLVVNYAGDAGSSSSQAVTIINIKPVETTVTINPVNGKVGDIVTITATTANITDGSTVTFTVDGTVIGDTTVANNTASIDYALNNAGAHILVVNYAGDAESLNSQAATLINIKPVETTVTVNPDNGAVTDAVVLNTVVTDANGNSVTSGVVNIIVNGNTYSSDIVNGTASATIPVNVLKAGNNIISVNYNGDVNYEPSGITYYTNGTYYGPVYYVAVNGSSSNNGRTPQTPWTYTYAFNTIQNSSYNNSLIYILNGNYVINNTVKFNKNLTIKVMSDSAVLDGNNNATNCFNIENGAVSIENITFTRFTNTTILNRANNTIISGNTFINNKGTNGGAINNYNTNNATIINNVFTNNTAKYGGAIYNRGNNTEITNNTFTKNNVTLSSGAIYNLGANTKITNNIFTDNTAKTLGGAISNWDATGTVITDNQFNGNQANYGGAIYYRGTTLILDNNTMTGNTALVSGGAVFVIGQNNNITNNDFTANKARSGAAINNLGTDIIIRSNTIAYNTAKTIGGAINNWNAGNTTIESNSIHDNQAQYGTIYLRGSNITVDSNSIYNNRVAASGAAIFNIGTNNTISRNMIDSNIAKSYGGAINNYNAVNTRITDNNLTGNIASYGGAIYTRATNTTITGNNITGNTATTGSAIFDIKHKTTIFENNTVKDNTAHSGNETVNK
ncbi:MAG: right-handed parallel beta-helix repeat-containing protein [Methanobacteriaceae archaeon]|nr:right-handed parallel beta-helix repeat-containing protein [Methanobacteriaceae archaeon]